MGRVLSRHELDGRFGATQFQQLIELAADQARGAMFVVDASNRVLHWSRGAEREFGRSAAEMIGQHCLIGVPCSGCLTRCALHANESAAEVRVRRADGRLGAYRRFVFPLRDDDSSYMGGVEVLVPLPLALADRAADGVVRFGALESADPAGIDAIDLLGRLAGLATPLALVSDDAPARLVAAMALHDPEQGPFVAWDGLDPAPLAAADRGTVFVDEIWTADALLQRILLAAAARGRPRVLVGARRPIRDEVRAGFVRPDLGAILAAGEVRWPALSERPEDVRRLVHEALDRWNARNATASVIDDAALERLVRWRWPGGETELRAVVERAAANAAGPIRLAHLPRSIAAPIGSESEDPLHPDDSRIRRALEETDGNMTLAADRLGISRATLYRHRRRLNL